MVKKLFRKQKPIKHIVRKVFLGIDFENNPKTGAFINAGLYGERKDSHGVIHKMEKIFHSQKELFEFLLSCKDEKEKKSPFILAFFNLSYDYVFLLPICDDSKLLMVGTRFISGQLKNGIKLYDIANQASDGSLKDWIDFLNMKETHGIEKAPLPSINDTMKEWDARVLPDAKATWVLTEYIQTFYNEHLKIPLTLTIGSGARRFFAQHYFKDYWKRDNPALDALERESYRGGRCEMFQRGRHNIWSYDVNSMYVSVMRDEKFPDPSSVKGIRNPKELPYDKLYIAKCNVTVPYQNVPPLPLFKDKLIFPVGTFTGVWCAPELEYAIKECGVTVNKIEWVLTYNGKPYFKDFSEDVWGERKKYPKSENEGMNLLIKKIGNSLYGGFGQRNDICNFAGKLEDIDMAGLPEGVKPIVKVLDGVEFLTVSGGEREDSEHTFTCVPSFITSYARLKWLKKAREHQGNIVYGDTDSVKFDIDLNKDSKELGGWGFEYNKATYFFAPKVYSSKPYGTPDKIKGVRKDAKLIKETDEYWLFRINKPNRYRESIRKGLVMNRWEDGDKKVWKKDTKRVWVKSCNISKPICINE